MANPASAAAVENQTCAICLDDILPGALVSVLNCNHTYHQSCFQPWLENHRTCPLDRVRITSINGVDLAQPNAPINEAQIQNPLAEARALWHNVRVIRNPSVHSQDPIERLAARTRIWTTSTEINRSLSHRQLPL